MLKAAKMSRNEQPEIVLLGIDSGPGGIECGLTANLSTTANERFIPERIVVSPKVGEKFALSDIRVGIEPVVATTSPMSLAVFTQEIAPKFRQLRAEVGMEITITVTCIARRPPRGQKGHRFLASVVGVRVPRCEACGY